MSTVVDISPRSIKTAGLREPPSQGTRPLNIAVKVEAADATAEAYATPLAEINPAKVERFQADTVWPFFARLRREDPVHFTPESEFGPYWSMTKWDDIMAVDTDHEAFSSADGIALPNLKAMEEQRKVMGDQPRRRGAGFISMDEPDHAPRRKAVSPTLAPANLAKMAPVVRERAGQILDSLPIGEEFDWVDRVSKELTAMTLATLFDFPFEQRRKLPWWSDMFMNQPGHGPVESWQQKGEAIAECFAAFTELWNQRVNAEPGIDMISMLAHNPATRDIAVEEYQGTVVLLIVGGNDTTRNTISGSIYALNKHPDQYDKLRANPDLVLPMVSETIRWQTPLAHMRRVATRDVEIGGKSIRKRRQRRHVVHLGQPRRDGDRESRRLHHRSRAAPPTHVLRLRHPPLRRQPRRRVAAHNHLGGDPQALPQDRIGERADPHLLLLRPRLRKSSRSHPGARLTSPPNPAMRDDGATLGPERAPLRRRDAEATRAAILAAAKTQFARLGYDRAALRDIATEAGADVALIKRYFGGKEALFTEALKASFRPDPLRDWDKASFAREIATLMAGPAHHDETRTHSFQFLLRAATSPTTAPLLSLAIQERFLGPIRDWLGGEEAPARARVLAAIVIGFLVERLIRGEPLRGRERAVFIDQASATFEAMVRPRTNQLGTVVGPRYRGARTAALDREG